MCPGFRDKAGLMSNYSIWLPETLMAKEAICAGIPGHPTVTPASCAVLTLILSQKDLSLDKLY